MFFKDNIFFISFPPDEALQRQEEIWQQEIEESLSNCRSFSHSSRPRLIDFLRITAPDDDITDTPATSPLPQDLRVSRMKNGIFLSD